VLTGNNLGQLASLTALPNEAAARQMLLDDPRAQTLIARLSPMDMQLYIKELLDQGAVEKGAAMAVLAGLYL